MDHLGHKCGGKGHKAAVCDLDFDFIFQWISSLTMMMGVFVGWCNQSWWGAVRVSFFFQVCPSGSSSERFESSGTGFQGLCMNCRQYGHRASEVYSIVFYKIQFKTGNKHQI